jgi:cytochrome c biogenesis protein
LISVKKKNDTNFKADILVNLDESIPIPNTDLKIKSLRFVPNFVIGSDGNIDTRSYEDRNPALAIEVSKGDSLLFKKWLFAKFPDFHGGEDEDYSFTLVDYDYHTIMATYTGIQVAKGPGSPFLWISFLLMTIGVLISFYIYHRKVWVLIIPDENKADDIEVFIAGHTNKNQLGLENEIKKLEKMISFS